MEHPTIQIAKATLADKLASIDAIPGDVVLPVMPGFDRDFVDELRGSDAQDDSALRSLNEAIGWVGEWVGALPQGVQEKYAPELLVAATRGCSGREV